MPALVVDHAALLRLIWTQNAVPAAINVLGVHNPGNVAITPGMAEALDSAIKGAMTTTGYGVHIHSEIALARIGIRPIHLPNMAEVLGTGPAHPGTAIGDHLPPQICLVVTLRTAGAGRSFRGRSYLWGFSEAENTPLGTAVSGLRDTAKTFIDAVDDALEAQGLDLAVVSRPVYSDAIPPVLIRAGFVNPVTVTEVRDGVWDTQRRRATPGV